VLPQPGHNDRRRRTCRVRKPGRDPAGDGPRPQAAAHPHAAAAVSDSRLAAIRQAMAILDGTARRRDVGTVAT